MKSGETKPFKPKQSFSVIQSVSNCESRGDFSRAAEGGIYMGRTQFNVQKHLHRVRFHFRGRRRVDKVKCLVERQEKGRTIFFDQGPVTAHHQSNIDDKDTSEITLDLDTRCKGIEGADFNPEGVKAAIKKILGLEVKKKHEDRITGHENETEAEMIVLVFVECPLTGTVVRQGEGHLPSLRMENPSRNLERVSCCGETNCGVIFWCARRGGCTL